MRVPSAFSHYGRDGRAKVRLSKAAAQARCVGDPHLIAYRCQACKGWHVGNSRCKTTNTPTEWTRTWERARVELGLAS